MKNNESIEKYQVLIVCDEGLKCASTGRIFDADMSDMPEDLLDVPRVFLPRNYREVEFHQEMIDYVINKEKQRVNELNKSNDQG